MLQTMSGKKVQALILAAIAAAMLAFGLSFAVQQAYALPPGGDPQVITDDAGNEFELQNISGGDCVTLEGVKAAGSSVTVPGTVGDYTVTVIASNTFKGCKATTVKLPSTIVKINSKAFKGSSTKTLILKTKKLTKKSVKNSLKGSNIKVVKVPKSMLKKYKKYFSKQNCGKKVKVVAI